MDHAYDYIIVGSGFGGSVSALRLSEKGYRVRVLEKGKRFRREDFAENNTDVKRWMWAPELGARGIYQMSFLSHVTILHGVGVGGGSLVYANTLPQPKRPFFASASWAHLADWEKELAPHYDTARRMLGATKFPSLTASDRVLEQIAKDIGREDDFHPTDVAVFFGKPGVEVPDPYFDGKGPTRVGCTQCGACMTGCRVGAKNTLDQNYLYLAEKLGCEVSPETEVTAVRAQPGGGYVLETRSSATGEVMETLRAKKVVLAGGVMGTMPLLLAMQADPKGLPKLSKRLGRSVRTNNESITSVYAPDAGENFSRGIAITSILHTDEHSHIEPVRYGPGSNFYRSMMAPHSPAKSVLARLFGTAVAWTRAPKTFFRQLTTDTLAEHSTVLLYMRTLEETLTLELGRSLFTGFRKGLVSRLDEGGKAPTAHLPEASALAQRFADKVGGVVSSLFTETLIGTPTTAHILGGACMGANAEEGVIDHRHEAFGYEGLYVIDGSAVSANPGVNPSLTITALAERAMSFIPPRAS